jgi:hypothetical protein
MDKALLSVVHETHEDKWGRIPECLDQYLCGRGGEYDLLPYLGGMTRSEFCTILSAGMSTTASNVLALYVFMLKEKFPTIAGHLVSASVLSAIAAIVMSKIGAH